MASFFMDSIGISYSVADLHDILVENGGHFEKCPNGLKMRLENWQQVESGTLECYQTHKSKNSNLAK